MNACINHKGNPGACPQVHICERCGGKLSEHKGTSLHCPRGHNTFSADAATRAKYPEQYADSEGEVRA